MNGNYDELWGIEAADLTNAYGTFYRSYAVDQTIKMFPQVAGVVYATEQCMSTTYLLRNQGVWIPICSRRGGAQGRRLTTIMFGCWLYRTHKEAQTTLAPDVTHSAYQDDTYRVGPLKQLEASWQPWLNAITAMGGQVNLVKSAVWIPGGDQSMIHVYKSNYRTYDLPFATDGLEMLGSVLQERNKTCIGNMEKKISKVAERLKKATDYASLILKLCESSIDFSAHTAYILLAKSLREAISYDASIMPPGAAMTLFMKHDELVRRLLAAIVSTPIEAIANIRYQLPGPLGGLGMRTTTLRSPPAYLANYIINGPAAEIIARKWARNSFNRSR